MDRAPGWLLTFLAGLLVLNTAGLAAVDAMASGSWCGDAGTTVEGRTYSNGFCMPEYMGIGTVLAFVALAGALVASYGLVRGRRPATSKTAT